MKASEIISSGIKLLYLYTNAHEAAFELYALSLTGQLKPEDEPLKLINSVIERCRSKAPK